MRGAKNDRPNNDGPPKLRGMTLANLTLTEKTQEWTLTDQVSVVGNDGPQSKTPSLLIKMYEKADKPVLNIGLLKVTTKKNRPTSRTIDINMKLSVQVTN